MLVAECAPELIANPCDPETVSPSTAREYRRRSQPGNDLVRRRQARIPQRAPEGIGKIANVWAWTARTITIVPLPSFHPVTHISGGCERQGEPHDPARTAIGR